MSDLPVENRVAYFHTCQVSCHITFFLSSTVCLLNGILVLQSEKPQYWHIIIYANIIILVYTLVLLDDLQFYVEHFFPSLLEKRNLSRKKFEFTV